MPVGLTPGVRNAWKMTLRINPVSKRCEFEPGYLASHDVYAPYDGRPLVGEVTDLQHVFLFL